MSRMDNANSMLLSIFDSDMKIISIAEKITLLRITEEAALLIYCVVSED